MERLSSTTRTGRCTTAPGSAREFSANAFERLFNSPVNIPDLDAPVPDLDRQGGFSSDMESSIEQAFGIFGIETNGPRPAGRGSCPQAATQEEKEAPLPWSILITEFINEPLKLYHYATRR